MKNFLYFLNNYIEEYKLALFILKIPKLQILSLSLLKNTLQSLMKVLYCFMNRIIPKNDIFEHLNIKDDQWENLINNSQFKKLMSKYEENLDIISSKLEETL